MRAFCGDFRTGTYLAALAALAAILPSPLSLDAAEPPEGTNPGLIGPIRRGLTDGAILFSGSPAKDPSSEPSRNELETIKRKVGINLFQGTLLDKVPSTAGGTQSDELETETSESSPAAGSTSRKPTHLRRAAYHLDIAAHQLELAEEYEQADQLRETATLLRQQARQIRSSQAGHQ